MPEGPRKRDGQDDKAGVVERKRKVKNITQRRFKKKGWSGGRVKSGEYGEERWTPGGVRQKGGNPIHSSKVKSIRAGRELQKSGGGTEFRGRDKG